MTVYQYKVPKKSKWSGTVPKAQEIETETEALSGMVDGQSASDLEERFAIALSQEGHNFDFQPSFISGRNMPGEIRPDFVVYASGQARPIMIDGDFVHKSSAQREADELNDQILDDYLRDAGYQPTIRLREGDEGVSLDSVTDCLKLVREIF